MGDKKRTFEAMFGGDQAAVDYSFPADLSWTPLPMPQEGDTLPEMVRKLQALAQIVEAGTSVAVHTGFTGTTHAEHSPILIAKAQMNLRQREMYEAWEQGTVMPSIAWDRSAKTVPKDPNCTARFAKQAAALDIIYSRAGTTPDNAAYFFSEFSFAVPLVLAVLRVEAVKRDLAGDQESLDELELETIARAVDVATKVIDDAFATVKKMAEELNRAKQPLQQRERAIKAKLPVYRHRRGNTNGAPGSVQRPAVDASVNFRASTTGSRHARTSFPVTDLTSPDRQPAYEECGAAVAARRRREVREGAPHVPDKVEDANNVA